MKKILAFMMAVLMIMAALSLPAFAEEIGTDAASADFVNETNSAESADEAFGELTESETSADTLPEETTAAAVQIDEWIYKVMKEATPEQMKLIEDIVLGGLNALDDLGIDGFDRVRIWVEHNMATVMVVALIVALVAFFVVTILQKKGIAKQSALLHSDAKDFYIAGQAQAEKSRKALKDYADRADEICMSCVKSAENAAKSAKEANGQVTEERAMLIEQLNKTAKVTAAMCETVNFLLQCSDLSQAKRDEAEAIYKRGLAALEAAPEVAEISEEVSAHEEHHQA